MSADEAYTGWMAPGDLEPGDCLGYVDADGQFAPGAAVVAVAPVAGTDLWNITTHAGSLVLRAGADVFVFAGAAVGAALHGYMNPPDPAWGDFCWQVTDEGEHCGWTAADHVGGAQ